MSTEPYLSPVHLEELRKGSAIHPKMIAGRGYTSIENPDNLPAAFASYQRRPGLLIPIRTVNGKIESWQLKPYQPRIGNNGKPLKYETAANVRQVLDVPEAVAPLLTNPMVALWITEGAKKVDAAISNQLGPAIGLQGVFGWRGTNEHGGKTALPDWEHIALNHREVILGFDSDVMSKQSVRHALERLAGFLASKGARVRYLLMPNLPDGSKCGLDDWFALGKTRDELMGHIHESLDDGTKTDAPDTVARADIIRLDEVEAKPIDWLWPNWLPRGMLTLLGGYAGDGKSTLTMSLAAALSTGSTLPDGHTAPHTNTLLLAAEDDLAHVVKPRLQAHDADMTRLSFLRGVVDGAEPTRGFNLRRDIALLRSLITEHQIGLVVIDPLSSYLSSSDRNNEGEVRDTLGPLVQMAEDTGVAIIGIMHIGKAEGRARAMQNLMGSTAFSALARCIWMVNELPEEFQFPDQPRRKMLGVVKSNYAVAPRPISFSRPLDGALEFHGDSPVTIEDSFAWKKKPVEADARVSRVDEAETWLLDYLDGTPKPSKPLMEAAALADIGEYSLMSAKTRLGVLSRRENSGWVWYPPQEAVAV